MPIFFPIDAAYLHIKIFYFVVSYSIIIGLNVKLPYGLE